MRDVQRARAVDAVDVLSDLVIDLVTGVMVFREYEASYEKKGYSDAVHLSVKRLCFFHLILSLCKTIEFWKRYRSIVPDELKGQFKTLVKTLENKKVPDFRNKYIGHIWDDDSKRPLVHSEIIEKIDIICEGDLDGFLTWINNPKGNAFPTNVVTIVEATRDTLVKMHKIRDDEFINR